MLSATNEIGQNFCGGIRFAMADRNARIICWVSGEALDRLEPAMSAPRERALCFERHRHRIEQLAGQKYDAGDASPVVMTFDVCRLC